MKFVLNPKVKTRWRGNHLIIMGLSGVKNRYSVMDEDTAKIFKYFVEGFTFMEIVQKIAKENPDVEKSLIQEDLKAFVQNLYNEGLISSQNQTNIDIESLNDFSFHSTSTENFDFTKRTAKVMKASLMLTYQCNLRCKHCYIPDSWRRTDELTTDQWFKVIDDLSDLGCFEVQVTGGEPLLRPDLLQILQYLDSKKIDFSLLTNAFLLTEQFVEQLTELNSLMNITISVYGLTDDSLKQVTQKNVKINNLYQNLEFLYKAKLPFGVSFIPLNLNYTDLEHFKTFTDRTGIELGLNYVPIYPKLDLNPESLNYSLTKDQTLEMLEKGLLKLKVHNELAICNGNTRTVILPDGNVSICELLSGMPIGNVKKESLSKIWLGREFHQLLQSFELNNDCKNCDYQEYCMRCNGSAYLSTGDWQGIDPEWCKIVKYKLEFERGVTES